MSSLSFVVVLSVGLLTATPAPADYSQTVAAQAAAHAKPGVRHIPARDVPVPAAGVSPQEQAIIRAPYLPIFNAHPKNAAEWKALVSRLADAAAKQIPALSKRFDVSVTPTNLAGIKCYIVEANNLPDRNRNRLLVHVHGGDTCSAQAFPRRARRSC
jgi:epsilon-lactone hydrolase